MAHWFHRNPLKATSAQQFQINMVAQDVDALKICSDLKNARARILELLPDPHHTNEQVDTAVKLYLAVLRGFLEVPQQRNNDDPDGGKFGGASKLRHSLRFRWTHSMLGQSPDVQNDAVFEIANILMNVAFWHMKHAAMIAAKEDLKVEEAKDVHTSLRKASGLIKFVKDVTLPQLVEKTKDGSDLDMRVIAAYLNQCTAEAQEVTIARAVELKHSAGLISALSNETSKMFLTAADSISTLDQKVFGHWRFYFALKSKFYASYAYNYQGESLLAQDKCGEAIRSLQESKKCLEQATNVAREYAKLKSPSASARRGLPSPSGFGRTSTAKPEQHAFFRRLSPIVNRTLEKCERENGFIYHQKVPFDPVELEIKDKTFGLVSPEPFDMPNMAPIWSAVAYAAFDISLRPDEKNKKNKSAEKVEGDIKPVKEVEIKQSDKDPTHESGCTIS